MKKWMKVMLCADTFFMVALGMITPIYAIFVEGIGGDLLDASWAWAIFAFTSGILMLLIGRWEDRHKHYATMLCVGYLLRSLSFLGYYFVESTQQLLGVQVILGISFAITDPSYDTLYSRYLKRGKEASEWGTWEALNMIVTAFAAGIGGLIADSFGFKVLFIVMAMSGLVGTLISALLLSHDAIKASR